MLRAGLVAVLVMLMPAVGLAQAPRSAAPPAEAAAPELKLDDQSALKAAAVDAQMSALLARSALLQRELQDMQQEWKKLLDERRKLIEDAAMKAKVDVKEPMEWIFDNKGQRYVKVRRSQ